MFRSLPAAHHHDEDLTALGAAMTAEAEDHPTPEGTADDEENPGIAAGYTYLGQLIDHDLTFDPVSSLQRTNDPDALVDFRTPRFDLDCVYGRGPSDQPYLYQPDGRSMLLGEPLSGNPGDPHAVDLPRNSGGRALIGDPRNDENRIVAQLQVALLRFHNLMTTRITGPFEHVAEQVRWHYQWIVLHDFLPTIVGQAAVDALFPHGPHQPPKLSWYTPRNNAFMPIEFSAAAYRFGHSMIRPIYRLNETIERRPIFSPTPDQPAADLGGFRPIPDDWAIDWRFFFPMESTTQIGRPQLSYKIDTSLVNPLGALPPSIAANPSSLAARNLLRGKSMRLPSGQSVARAIRVPVIPDADLRIGKANEADQPGTPLLDISPHFANNAPLWFYILREAQQAFVDDTAPIRLGPVGATLVAETFVGLLWHDSHSYLRQHPTFTPRHDLQNNGSFGIKELIAAAVGS
ncbi:heme peroxidase family protein [Paraconexibacter antarcticus]|uniref:Heme peroxidase family protein n=1 Tax=Paraconexibacter antarcticus TaxID=2949664 RepID=A0ABY5DQS3_9ACTN|nr:heme peroxidase family protein [Paraconexibacter antarcticus]UTI64373.1 heme peroxidase family protein [Paraconexibacter antarcticus]